METNLYSNGNKIDIIEYNKLIYILNSKRLNSLENLIPLIQTKKGIIYGDFVHVYTNCTNPLCKICIRYNKLEINLTQIKFISKL